MPNKLLYSKPELVKLATVYHTWQNTVYHTWRNTVYHTWLNVYVSGEVGCFEVIMIYNTLYCRQLRLHMCRHLNFNEVRVSFGNKTDIGF